MTSGSKINTIRLKNFRKHEDLTLEFDSKFNLINGRNNAGKSTIFYAIEYCLFGSVQGFKKISQLAKFKQDVVGVELVFKGKDDNIYKLQRMHYLKGKTRSAKGFYTLKQVNEEGEKYLLASDFGNREEDLSLKINEILGISKRFFETGIHFYQGTVSQILSGEKKLDIVFGIRSALALSDVFKEKALEYEREVKNIESVEKGLKQSKKEKEEYKKKMESQEQHHAEINEVIVNKEKDLSIFQGFDTTSKTLFESIDDFSQKRRKIENLTYREETLHKDISEIVSKYGEIDTLKDKHVNLGKTMEKSKTVQEALDKKVEELQKDLRELESQKVKIETVSKQIKSKLGDKNDVDDLQETLANNKKEMEKLTKTIEQLDNSIESIQEDLRKSAQIKGDSEGILKRREKTKDNPTCEYCGAPIDASKIQEEIKELKKKLEVINKDIKAKESEEKQSKNDLLEIREKKDNLDKQISEFETNIKEIEELEKEITFEEKRLDINDVNKKIEETTKTLEAEKETLNKEREDEKKIRDEFNELESSINRIDDLEAKIAENTSEKEALEQSVLEIQAEIIEKLKNFKEELTKTLENVSEKEREELEGREEGEEEKEKTNEFKTAFDLVPSGNTEAMRNQITSLIDKMDALEKNFTLDLSITLKEDLKEFIIAKTSEISTSLEHIKNQQKQLISEMEESMGHIKRLDKDIATMENALQILHKKKELAERYRNFQQIFKEAQGIIRENASKLLEDEILKLHQLLSSDDEFERVHIDSDDYSLAVTPKGMDPDNEYYPAWVYEGGGHKLILGLAYKFALGNIIGNRPFILVDEPTEFMDQQNRINLLSKLSSTAKDTQVILITHQDVDKIKCEKKIEIQK